MILPMTKSTAFFFLTINAGDLGQIQEASALVERRHVKFREISDHCGDNRCIRDNVFKRL